MRASPNPAQTQSFQHIYVLKTLLPPNLPPPREKNSKKKKKKNDNKLNPPFKTLLRHARKIMAQAQGVQPGSWTSTGAAGHLRVWGRGVGFRV